MGNEYRKKAEKSMWQRLMDGFKPAAVRADENIAERRGQGETQYQKDMKLPLEQRLKKTQKGFLGEKE